MKDFNFINLNQLTWHLNIALTGLVFAIFCLIYNEYYIYYGLFTFVLGVAGHIFYKLIYWISEDDEKNKFFGIYYLFNIASVTIWLHSLVNLYL